MVFKKSQTWSEATQDSQNWNNAKAYSFLLLDTIVRISKYREMAYNGSTELIDEFIQTEEEKNQGRLIGLKRWIQTEKFLINDSKFLIWADTNKVNMNSLQEYLETIAIIEKSHEYARTGRVDQTKINYDIFWLLVKMMEDIHYKTLNILNKNDLIMKGSEEYDVYEGKREAILRMAEA